MRTNKYFHISLLLAAAIAGGLCASCKKFLEVPPSKTTSLEVTTAAQLDALLNNYSAFFRENNITEVYGTDDYELSTTLYNARPASFSMRMPVYGLWDVNFLPRVAGDNFWSGEYNKIFNANLVLASVDDVSGTAEEKAVLRADAHFIRAYSYFRLANTFCLPYTDADRNEAGLPLKTATSFEAPVERQSLEKTYALIEADLAEAMKTTVPLLQNGRARHWRASKAGVNAFAARYYLARNNYAEALKFANASLAEYSILADYNQDMRYGNDAVFNLDGGTPAATSFTIKYPYTHDNQANLTDMLAWKELLYLRILENGDFWYAPSKALLDLYDKDHDLRYRYHVVEGYSYDRGMTKPSYNYPGYVFFYKDRLPSGPTVSEMLLIRAEALARSNQPAAAMAALNQLRAKRMTPGPWVNLSAGSEDEAIARVLEERRRELPFTQRWSDIRRFNTNSYAGDDVTLQREFYSFTAAAITPGATKIYTLPKGSRRWAVPVPETEIISSNGAIQQNTY